MKHITILIMICIGFICTASQCKRDDCHRINFINNSSKDLYVRKTFGRDDFELDTLNFPRMFGRPPWPEYYSVKSGEKRSLGLGRRDCFDYWTELGNVFVYVFDAEVLATVPWDTIGKYHMVLKIYNPTIEEMERSNWTITYTEK